MITLGILGSTRGTVMLSLIDAIEKKQLAARIAIVLSNKADAKILENAQKYALPQQFVDPNALSKEEYDQKLSALLTAEKVDLVLLIGYMKILSKPFITAWQHKIMNVHPSLLPEFAGGMDLNVHQAVIDAKKTQSGCTVHYVTEEVDGGPIIIQKKCDVLVDDNAERLKARVQALEASAFIEAIQTYAQRPYHH